MSGAAGLAAARRRRGAGGSQQASSQSRVQQPPPVPQQQQPPRQHQQNIPNSQVYPEPTSPMAILQQHHMKIDEHVTSIEAIRKNIEEMKKKEELMSQQYEERMVKDRNETLEFVKGNMLEPLENDLQSILNGYQLKIDMLSSTMNTQQNYIMELNTTLLGIVKQMTKLLAIKESEGGVSFNTVSSNDILGDGTTEMISETDDMDTVEGTDYFAGKAPLPYEQDNTPIATFGDDQTGIQGDGMDIVNVSDEVAPSKQGEPIPPTVIVGEASTSTKEPGSQVNDTDTSQDQIDSSSEHPEVDLSVE